MGDKLQAERDYELQYIAEEIKFLSEVLELEEGTAKYSALKQRLSWFYRDAWGRGSDYRMEEDLRIMKESRDV